MSINSVKNDSIGQDSVVNAQKPIAPTITNYSVDGVDDEALDPAGGQTVLINGSGFQRGATVTFDGTAISVVSWVSSSQLSFTAPAKSAGTYNIYVVNSDGGTAIYIPGIIYSTFPTWTTAQGTLGSYYETQSISKSVVATGDAPITYSLVSGSLPSGATLASDGTITGTSPVESGSTTYSFTVQADDAELQSSTRSFSLTINTDVVTWVTPSSGATINLDGTAYSQALSATDAAGYSVSYSANALPTGLTLDSSTISGTPTTEGSTSTLLTATAATTNRTATNTITWVVSLSDAYWKYATLLLTANSSIQTSSFVSDNSINNQQLTVVGDTRANNFNPYQQGYYSNYFDGTGDYLTVADNSLLEIGLNTDFTVEFWFNASSRANAYNTIFSKGASGIYQPYYFSLLSSGNLAYWSSSNGTAWNIANGVVLGAPSLNQWHHVAVSRQGTNTYLFLNGTLVNTISNSGDALYNNTTALAIGARSDNTEPFNGYVSNARIVNGTGLYATSFTPSATPLLPITNTVLLTCQSNRLIDNSVNNFTITKNGDTTVSSAHPFSTVYQAGTQYYSTSFNGSTDYLTLPTNTGYDFGTGDFTIECWINPSAITSNRVFMSTQSSSSAAAGWSLFLFSTGYIVFDVMEGSEKYVTCSTTQLTVGNWYHVAFTRQSGTLRIFVNGVSQTFSGTQASSINSAVGLTIGRQQQAGYEYAFAGLISNARVVKGTSLYNSGFTPSTSPLTAVSGTTALTCQDSTLKDNSTNNFTITGNGNAVPVAVSPFTPSSYTNTEITTYGSGYFDGSTDYIQTSAISGLQFGTGDFTVECWAYLTTLGSYNGIFDTRTLGGTGISMVIFSNGTIECGTGGAYFSAGGFTTNRWNHIAYTRQSGTNKIFLNGVQIASANITTDFTANYAFIGKTYDNWHSTGYISDVRVVKGTALYTSNFVPQFTSPLTNVTNTQLLTLQNNGSHNNSTFKDQSSFNNVITRNGNTTNGTFSPYGDNWSNYLDGTGDYLVMPSSAVFAFGTGDYTIEGWFYKTNSIFAQILGFTNDRDNLDWNANGTFNFFDGSATTTVAAAPSNQWVHLAYTRSSGTVRIFINGVLVTTVASSFNSSTNRGMVIGARAPSVQGSNPFPGYVSNVRVVKGTAVYTADFTPSTTPLTNISGTSLLTCQSNRFIDNSPNNFTITKAGDVSVQKFSPFSTVTVPKYYSTYFNGSTDQLSISTTTLALGTGSFTIECWVYLTTSNSTQCIIDLRNTSTSTTGFFMGVVTSGLIQIWSQSNILISSGTVVGLNSWNHIAVTRNGSSMTAWLNGVSVGTSTNSTNWTDTSVLIGKSKGLEQIQGYISNLRIVKGTALYTSSFTPSATPLTAVENTALLTCQDNAINDNSTNNLTITAVTTTVKPLPVSPFTPTASSATSYSPTVFGGSMYFDGSGDYVRTNSMPATLPADFTIEGWVYATTLQTYKPLYTLGTETSGRISFYMNASGQLSIARYGVVTDITFSTTSPANQWTHFAFVRVGSTITGYLNGVVAGTGSLSGTLGVGTQVSVFTSAATDAYGSGYLSDLRVTHSALYTSNFYPGPTPLTPTTTIGANTYSSTLLLSGTSGGVVDATRTVDLETVADTKVVNGVGPYNGNYYSNYFDGTSDWIYTPSDSNLAFGTGDFTVEAFVKMDSSPTDSTRNIISSFVQLASPGDHGIQVIFNGTNTKIEATIKTNNSSYTTLTSVNSYELGKWYHVAFVRTGTTVSLFVNGTREATNTASNDHTESTWYIGRQYVNSTSYERCWYGNISNVRLIKGSGPYDATLTTLTVPTGPLDAITNTVLLTSKTNKFTDYSVNNFTLTSSNAKVATQNPFQVNTGQSYYFDGTGDYLTIPYNQLHQMVNEDFTIEAWVYRNVLGAEHNIAVTRSSASSDGWNVRINSSNTFQFYFTGGGSVTSTGTIAAGVWTHIAVTKSGNTARLYINGVNDGTNTSIGTGTLNTQPLRIGIDNTNAAGYMNGYISDLRITKGYARTITVPTTPYKLN